MCGMLDVAWNCLYRHWSLYLGMVIMRQPVSSYMCVASCTIVKVFCVGYVIFRVAFIGVYVA